MRWFAAAAVALMLAGCSGGGGGAVEVTAGTTPAGVPAPATSAPRTDDEAQPTRAARTTAPEDSEPTVESEETFTMPGLKGMNLQDAQDELQKRGSYLMDQEDASGEHRIQLVDSNWKVCTQIPRAGRKVPISTIVRLAAVKLDESCP